MFGVYRPAQHVTNHREKCPSLTANWVSAGVGGYNRLLRKKQNDLMRTKYLRLSTNTSGGHSDFSGQQIIQWLVSTYTGVSVTSKVQNISMDVSGLCMWLEGRALYSYSMKEKMGIIIC